MFLSLLLASLWLLNLTLFHAWAGGGPPSDYPEWHFRWSKIFGLCSLAGFISAFLALWFWRPRR